MKNLFETLKVGRIEVANRVWMAPMTRNRAAEGNVPWELNAEYYRQRAQAGLIISEATQVSQQGQGYPNTPGIHSAEQVEGWRKVTSAVHGAGGKMVAQVWHTGRASHSFFQPGNGLPVAPSAVANRGQVYVPGKGMVAYETPRELELGEIPGIVGDYVRGAKNAVAAGFDGIEIHGANGYLVDQFLRDGTNRRVDGYGGSIERRARFALEIVDAIAAEIGADRMGIRLSPSSTFNDMADSTPRETFGYLVKQLAARKLAYLHLIAPSAKDAKHGGAGHDLIPVAYFREMYAGVLVANGGYTYESAAEMVGSGEADAITFGTAFLANPDLVERFRNQAELNKPDPSTFYGGSEKGYTDYPSLALASSR